jgi:spermidine synthase
MNNQFNRGTRIEITPIRNKRGQLVRHLVMGDTQKIMMSNDDIELEDIEQAAKSACGNCLVAGLGMGLIVDEIAHKSSVRSIDVLEIDKDVIRVGWEFISPRLDDTNIPITVIHIDALKFKPPVNKKYDWVFADWWQEPTKEAYEEMLKFFSQIKSSCSETCVFEAWKKDWFEQGHFYKE